MLNKLNYRVKVKEKFYIFMKCKRYKKDFSHLSVEVTYHQGLKLFEKSLLID